ncbi:ras GTPase-activating protein-binding protein 1-like isoform X2 [Chenopodium quinoa]|uniref:ras GTPase-activating protein-binding protein 1-like isoform X2 n=1 Tax=Chenopodium quinoa TaxID=63459 RepID=UPI000B771F30|nr:ras GTPase-activating protein-binding protein 1-like isoform X2 [Chenopodium quinoa]
MAAQTDAPSSDFSAETVGNAFVGQFYKILHQSPELVYRFYQDSSTMSRPGPDGTLATVTAMEGIKGLILSLDCTDYKVEILTADAQASYMNGVIVLVTGCLTGKDNVRRNFTESFFLGPQNKGGFFVLNDTFRFIEEDSTPEVNSVEEKDVDKSAPASPVIPVEDTTETSNATVNHAPVTEDVAKTNISEDEPKLTVTQKAVPQASVDSGLKVQPVAETLSNGHVDAPKKSYASLLKNGNEGATKAPVHRPTIAAKAPTSKAPQKNVAPSPAAQPTRPAAPVSATVSESSAPNGSNEKGHSVYIGDLPFDATPTQIEQEFKKFGRIKRNGIQVRSNKGYCFGFVEYEDAAAKQKAIELGYINIGGKEAFIEEKKTSTKVVNGVSTYPSGRNGFRNDGFRGRGNFSNGGRGYVRSDNGRRNGEVPSRGNRNGDGFVYHNGGGRGGRQGAAPAPK